MYALIFTNTILGIYLSYIIAEKRKRSWKSVTFWLILLLFLASLLATCISISPEGSIKTVKEIMLP